MNNLEQTMLWALEEGLPDTGWYVETKYETAAHFRHPDSMSSIYLSRDHTVVSTIIKDTHLFMYTDYVSLQLRYVSDSWHTSVTLFEDVRDGQNRVTSTDDVRFIQEASDIIRRKIGP